MKARRLGWQTIAVVLAYLDLLEKLFWSRLEALSQSGLVRYHYQYQGDFTNMIISSSYSYELCCRAQSCIVA